MYINDNFETFLDEKLLVISNKKDTPCFVDLVNYLVAKVIPLELSYQQKKIFSAYLKHYCWGDSNLYRCREDQIFRRCIQEDEMRPILEHCHSFECEGHFGDKKQQLKYLNQDFIGHLCSKTPMPLWRLVISVKEWGTNLIGMHALKDHP